MMRWNARYGLLKIRRCGEDGREENCRAACGDTRAKELQQRVFWGCTGISSAKGSSPAAMREIGSAHGGCVRVALSTNGPEARMTEHRPHFVCGDNDSPKGWRREHSPD